MFLRLDTDAPVEIVDVDDNIKRQMFGALKRKQSVEFVGEVILHVPVSACTSKILVLALYPGVHLSARDPVLENEVYQHEHNVIQEFLNLFSIHSYEQNIFQQTHVN